MYGTAPDSPRNKQVSSKNAHSNLNLDAYLREVRKLWPQHIFFYKEELALMYLAFKSYQVDKALISIYTCADELLQLITLEYNRVKVSQK